MHSRTIVRSGFVAFNALAHVFRPLPRTQRALMRVTTPARPQDRGRCRRSYVSPIPSATSDVRLRAKADHQRIRNRVRGIGRSDHGDVIISDPTRCSGIATSAQTENPPRNWRRVERFAELQARTGVSSPLIYRNKANLLRHTVRQGVEPD